MRSFLGIIQIHIYSANKLLVRSLQTSISTTSSRTLWQKWDMSILKWRWHNSFPIIKGFWGTICSPRISETISMWTIVTCWTSSKWCFILLSGRSSSLLTLLGIRVLWRIWAIIRMESKVVFGGLFWAIFCRRILIYSTRYANNELFNFQSNDIIIMMRSYLRYSFSCYYSSCVI